MTNVKIEERYSDLKSPASSQVHNSGQHNVSCGQGELRLICIYSGHLCVGHFAYYTYTEDTTLHTPALKLKP